jgi:hypothetical protein
MRWTFHLRNWSMTRYVTLTSNNLLVFCWHGVVLRFWCECNWSGLWECPEPNKIYPRLARSIQGCRWLYKNCSFPFDGPDFRRIHSTRRHGMNKLRNIGAYGTTWTTGNKDFRLS